MGGFGGGRWRLASSFVLSLGLATGACGDKSGGAATTSTTLDVQFPDGQETTGADGEVVGDGAETTTEVVQETQVETVAETLVETVAETTEETLVETVAETTEDTVAETVAETTEDTVAETVVETIAETVAETEVNGPRCGNGTCDDDEDCLDCAADCAPCPEKCGADLFMAEYLEGTSWNKAIAIANFTGHDVDLVDYGVGHITNGGAWSEALPALKLSGILAHGEVFVVCHGSSVAGILERCDQSSTANPMEFNGDDAVGLFRNGALIDAVGTEGSDPGSGWAVGAIAKGTMDHTLLRKAKFVSGNIDWTTAQNEWLVHQNDEIQNLGKHDFAATCTPGESPRIRLNEFRAGSGGTDFVELLSIAPAETGETSLAGWRLATTGGSYTFPAATPDAPGATLAAGGYVELPQATLGFGFGKIDMVWLYDPSGKVEDVASWGTSDFAAPQTWGRLPNGTGAFQALSVATPGAENANPDHWCGDGTCDVDENCGTCASDCDICQPLAGDLRVTEVLATPAVGAGAGPEWFEVENTTALSFDLQGLILSDDGNDFHVVAPAGGSWIIAPGERVVFGSAAAAYVDYVYAGLALDADDEIVIATGDAAPVEIVRQAWTQLGDAAALTLTEAAPAVVDAAGAASLDWCLVPLAEATPGAANASCAVCGDTLCSVGETCTSCEADCGACCGDGTCAADEDCTSCEADCGVCTQPGCATELFISEYLEGTSQNKALEIANFTGAEVDLAGYSILKITNGGTWGTPIALTGKLADGDVFVICNSAAAAAVLAVCDLKTGSANWNGDDAVGLAKAGAVIDAIGEPTPSGKVWAAGGVVGATQDHDLQRDPDINTPTVDWAGTSATDWIVGPPGDFSGLGAHAPNLTCGPAPVP